MMKIAFYFVALCGSSYAFPEAMMQQMADYVDRESSVPTESMLRARQLNTDESNCGPIPCVMFNEEEQFVSIAGKNTFVAPAAGDRRGPCPGLNAAANHGYIPHSGIMTVEQTVDGLTKAYGMGADLAAILATYAVVFDGDIGSLTWSIGGPYQPSVIGSIGGAPQGISYSHNKYEGDASATRSDAYLANGDAHSLVLEKFQHLYNLADRYTLANLRDQNLYNRKLSEATNPYYFSAQFSGLLVVPAAHNFIINFMSNHSADEPSGYLDKPQLKDFFAISGPDDALVWNPGYERIPEQWYRRPNDNPYTTARAIEDVVISAAMYPATFQLGGNLGKVNTFAGVDVGNLTGGAYNAASLLEGHNLGCLIFQALPMVLPDTLKYVVSDIAPVLALVNNVTAPVLGDLSCPELTEYNQGLFNRFPGYAYNPTPGDN